MKQQGFFVKFLSLVAFQLRWRGPLGISVARIFDWGGPIPVADLENFGGGDFTHKPSFGPESEIRTFFSAQNQMVSKKKKKVFTEIESDFSAETVTFTVTVLLNYCYVRNY